MNTEIENYLSVLDIMRDELRQESPIPHVLESCRVFLTESPLPVPCITVSRATVFQWGNA